jgi:hypothetical protein
MVPGFNSLEDNVYPGLTVHQHVVLDRVASALASGRRHKLERLDADSSPEMLRMVLLLLLLLPHQPLLPLQLPAPQQVDRPLILLEPRT